jgi:adenylate cyclase
MAMQRPPRTGFLAAALRGHVRQGMRHRMVRRFEWEWSAPAAGGELVVCFVDLVGFTSLGEHVTPEELATVAARLGKLAADVVRERVRLVKTIGDAAMFVGPEVPPMVEAALSLVDVVKDEQLLAVHSGIARGSAVQRAGDVYGNAVNLASRVTGVARAGSVLSTKEVRDAAGESFAWRYAGRHRLRGVSELLPLYSARRLAGVSSLPT